ncbi:hypothetical protein Gohar_002819, partial [Gossypium harknessii]|nr:hypothetical protein [Gossypium harknessii]
MKDKIKLIHQTTDNECFRCSEKRETLVHALKDFPNAQAILTIRGLDGRIINNDYSSCTDCREEAMRGKEEAAWVIWERPKSLSKEFRIHNMINRPILLPHIVDKKWEKLPTDKVKINFDAAIINDKTGFGVLTLDSIGFVMGGNYGFKEDRMQAEWAELCAFEESIKVARSLNI